MYSLNKLLTTEKSSTSSTDLLFTPQPNPDAFFRLICFSYAGGTSDIYLPWASQLSTNVELVVCQLPGRSSRLMEAPYLCIEPLIADLITAIKPLVNKPLIFFGHSMGSKIAYELLLAMREHYLPTPLHFIVSACGAPQLPRRRPAINKLPDALFIIALSRLNGTPISILKNAEVMQLVLPALRADFSLIENYSHLNKKPIDTSLTLLGGTEDTVIDQEDLLAWQDLMINTSVNTTTIEWIAGDHFFIKSNPKAVVHCINQLLLNQRN